LFTVYTTNYDNVSTTSTAGDPVTELISKCINKKVTKYLVLLNTFAAIFCVPVLLKNVVHKATLMVAFV